MKLSQETVALILEATELCNMLGVEGLVLDDQGIRGYNDDEGVVVASLADHGFEFDKILLSRLSSLKHKAALLKDLSLVKVVAVNKKGNDDVVEKLVFNCGKINFEFRCAANRSAVTDIPTTKMNTTPLFYFDITHEDVETVTKGSNAMRSKNMTIRGKSDDIEFRFSDETGDVLNFTIDSKLASTGDDDEVSLTINIKKMLPIFKLASQIKRGDQEDSFRLNILKNNIVHVAIGNMDVIVMPEV